MDGTDEEVKELAQIHQFNWYGWGSPVGLVLFFLLVATAAALVRLAFR
jgi:hypothetical protein